MTNDKDSAVRQANREWEVSDFDDDREMADWARAWGVNLLEVASLRQPTQSEDKCVECNGNGYTEIIGGYEHTCEVCYGEGFLRQPTQSDKPLTKWQKGFNSGVEEAAKALEADAMKCDCASREERECACGAWNDYKTITSARAVEIVRELKNVPPPEGDGGQ